MDTKDGERLAVANSVWTLFDFEKNVPARITPEIIAAYPLEPCLEMDYASRKIQVPEDGERITAEEIVVKNHHLDTNNHVNNGQYIKMAMDMMPDKDLEVSSMRVEYRKQARLGDVLYPEIVKVSKNHRMTYTISLKDNENGLVCVVELSLAEH